MDNEQKREMVRKISNLHKRRQTILVKNLPGIAPEIIDHKDKGLGRITAIEGGSLTGWFSDRSTFGKLLSILEELGVIEKTTEKVYSLQDLDPEELRFLKRLIVEYNWTEDDINARWDHAADSLGVIDLEN